VSSEQFATCVADRLGENNDRVISAIREVAVEEWREFIEWFRSLRDSDRALFLALLGIGAGIIVKVIEGAFGAAGTKIAAAIIILLGVAAWASIIDSLTQCSDRL